MSSAAIGLSKAQLKCSARDLEEVMQAVDYLKAHSLNTVEDLDTLQFHRPEPDRRPVCVGS